jgi:AcrR family transcriptional regulator
MTKPRTAPSLRLAEGAPPSPKQARSLEKRERIIAAARTVFEEYGYERAQVDEIAARAGTASGAFYLSFKSKRQLLVELMNQLLATLTSLTLSLPDDGDPRAALHGLLRTALRADRENYGVIKAWLEAAEADDELRAMNHAIRAWSAARVHAVFELVLERTASPRPPDLAAFARIMDNNLWMLLARLSGMSEKEFDEEVRVTSDMIYCYLIGAASRRT